VEIEGSVSKPGRGEGRSVRAGALWTLFTERPRALPAGLSIFAGLKEAPVPELPGLSARERHVGSCRV
jgi:hypothetical protein